jgi:hypothetical protein
MLRTFAALEGHKDKIVGGRGPPATQEERAMGVDLNLALIAGNQRPGARIRTGYERWDAFLSGLAYAEQSHFSGCRLMSETDVKCKNEWCVGELERLFGDRLRAHFTGLELRLFAGDVERRLKAEAA